MECPQNDAGCSHTCQRILLPAHLKDACKYVEVPCPEGQCTKSIFRKDLASHTHVQDTSSPAEPSLADPGSQAPPTDAVVPSTSDHPKDNLATEPAAALRGSGDAQLSGPSTGMISTSYESLENENARLRLRLSALEGVINTLRYELQAVRRALGPWYRTEDSDPRTGWGGTPQQPARTSTQSSPPRPTNTDPLALSRASSSTQEGNASVAASSVPPPLTSPGGSVASLELAGGDISSYFPPAEEEDVYSPDFIRPHQPQARPPHQNAGAGPSHIRDPSLSHHPHLSSAQHIPLSLPQPQPALGGMNPAYPPSVLSPATYPNVPAPYAEPGTISIPPLDPSMPLPNTLASLHGSIASLAGALGALATTRAQDALYTGEELRSMRAGIHGLRMQFHDMLTAQAVSRDTSAGVGSSMRASDPDGVGPGGIPISVTPSAWATYGPRPYGMSGFPHMPGGFTKL